jgi:hypothetical protein
MLRNVQDLLKSEVTLNVYLGEDIATHLLWLLNSVSEEHDSREGIATSENSLAAIFGLDRVYYADDNVADLIHLADLLNINYMSTYVRLYDCLVIDQLIINHLSTYDTQENTTENSDRITSLLLCMSSLRGVALQLVMQLA